MPPHVARLLKLMKQWQAKVGDTLAIPARTKDPRESRSHREAASPDQWQPDWIVKKYFEGVRAPVR